MIDLSKLTPDDFAAMALGRNALDVMMRRGWGVYSSDDGDRVWWSVSLIWVRDDAMPGNDFPDPFTALVKADKWMTAQEKTP